MFNRVVFEYAANEMLHNVIHSNSAKNTNKSVYGTWWIYEYRVAQWTFVFYLISKLSTRNGLTTIYSAHFETESVSNERKEEEKKVNETTDSHILNRNQDVLAYLSVSLSHNPNMYNCKSKCLVLVEHRISVRPTRDDIKKKYEQNEFHFPLTLFRAIQN